MAMRRAILAGLLGAAILSALLGGANTIASAAGQGQATVPVATYGSQLFLLNPPPGGDSLSGLPLTLHGFVYGPEAAERYVVSGGPDLAAAAAAAGIPAELLDVETAGKTYYFVDATVEGASALAGQQGSILYADDAQLLLAVDLQGELAMLEALPAQGVNLALLPPEGLPLPAQVTGDGGGQSIAPGTAAAVPTISALLAQVTTGEIYTRIAQLSGVWAISTPTGSATLSTRYTFAGNARTVEAAVWQQFASLGYSPSYSNWSYGSYSGRNVVADLRGTLHPERVWLVGGHFDSNSNSPYAYAPGADDNASGLAASLALARILKDQRFSDTIRFVAFGAEEQGKWGSLAYAQALWNAGVQVMGYVDLDMIGWDGDGDRTVEIHTGTRSNSLALGQRFADANLRYGQGLRVELKQASASRFSDHASFWDYSYPAFLTIENFFDDALPRDRNPYYHNTGDTLSRINLDYVVRTTRTALAMLAEAAGLADGTATPAPTSTHTPTSQPSSCTELIANGGFEATAAWSFGPTATQAGYSTAQKHSGARSVRMGMVGAGGAPPAGAPAVGEERSLTGELAPDGASYSSAYQTIAVPAGSSRVTLSFWRRPGSEGAGGDFQRAMLLRPDTYGVIATLFRDLAASDWQQMVFDLSAYRGQQIVVYFEVYNDETASAPRAWMYLDDVSVQACSGGVTSTSTPTSTATLAASATPTATTSTTPAPTATPTTTPSPGPENCTENVANGGFELAGGWSFAVTGNPGGYTTARANSGARAARLGVVPAGMVGPLEEGAAAPGEGGVNLLGEMAPAGASYSTVYQTLRVPAAPPNARLSYWAWAGTESTAGGGDFQRVMLLRPGSYAVLQTLSKSLANATGWQRAEFDLSAYAGQSVVVYFEVYNDNTSGWPRTWLYVDDVSVAACSTYKERGRGGEGASVWLPLLLSAP